MKNIEIKFRIEHLEELYRHLVRLEAVSEKWLRHQKDVYFNVARGRLKMRLETGSDAQLIYYRRSDEGAARESLYEIYYPKEPEQLSFLLEQALGKWIVVEKQRRLLMFRNVRIHLDRVENLGEFLEFESVVDHEFPEEAAKQNLAEIRAHLNGFRLMPVPGSYSDLLTSK